ADHELLVLRLEVDVRGALVDGLRDDRPHQLDHGCVVRGLAQVRDLGRRVLVLLDGLLDGVLEAVEARDQPGDVLLGGDRRSSVSRSAKPMSTMISPISGPGRPRAAGVLLAGTWVLASGFTTGAGKSRGSAIPAPLASYRHPAAHLQPPKRVNRRVFRG